MDPDTTSDKTVPAATAVHSAVFLSVLRVLCGRSVPSGSRMTRESRLALEPIPIAMAALVALTLAMPLRWWTLGASAIALTAIVGRLRRARGLDLALAATIALSIVDAIVLGYAALALMRPGVFGPVTRLGYPLLVASGLRLEGGAWLVLLCGLVSLVPSLFRSDPVTASS